MTLARGTRLGVFEIVEVIGRGGMGEVYRATDTVLGREVAIKVLPESLAAEEERVERFEYEARTLAALNHLNIAQIHGLERSGQGAALVMELVEGRTLAERIEQGPIPIDESIDIAAQIAAALEAAHGRGIVHRDLKPANIKLRPDGIVKVLDFGIARVLERGPEDSLSVAAGSTEVGAVLGTAAYMAPEQARGKPVDQRADIWAFACVLYEMLTGQPAFGGEDNSVTTARILERDVDWTALPSSLPPAVRRTLRLCLEKDARKRLHHIADARLGLEGAFEAEPAGGAAQSGRGRRRTLAWGAAGAVAGAIGFGAWAGLNDTTQPPRVERFTIATAPGAPIALSGGNYDIAITPDGDNIVFSANDDSLARLHVRPIGELWPSRLEGFDNASAFAPFISPDGEWVAFNDQLGNLLLKMSIHGGPPIRIADVGSVPMRGAFWGTDGQVVFGSAAPGGLWRVPADGGEPEEITTVASARGELNHIWPSPLPGGRQILFTVVTGASADAAEIAVYDLDSGEQRTLIPGGSFPVYVPSGHIVYGIDGTLRAIAFDVRRSEVIGNPVRVLDGVMTKATGAANFAVAADGTLVYIQGEPDYDSETTLAFVDLEGRVEPLAIGQREYRWLRVSPDGTKIVLEIVDGGNSDIWVSEFGRGALSRVTSDPAEDNTPVWTPDGERIVFRSNRNGSEGIYARAADGRGEVEALATIDGKTEVRLFGWSPDGRNLIFGYGDPDTSYDLGLLPVADGGPWRPLLVAPGIQGTPVVSPNGRWFSYNSNETGQHEIYIERFPAGGGRRQVSTDSGVSSIWAPDSETLYYRRWVDGAMMRARIESEPDLFTHPPEFMFEQPYVPPPGGRRWDLTGDGSRFVMLLPGTSADASRLPLQIVVVRNWLEELKRIVPTD